MNGKVSKTLDDEVFNVTKSSRTSRKMLPTGEKLVGNTKNLNPRPNFTIPKGGDLIVRPDYAVIPKQDMQFNRANPVGSPRTLVSTTKPPKFYPPSVIPPKSYPTSALPDHFYKQGVTVGSPRTLVSTTKPPKFYPPTVVNTPTITSNTLNLGNVAPGIIGAGMTAYELYHAYKNPDEIKPLSPRDDSFIDPLIDKYSSKHKPVLPEQKNLGTRAQPTGAQHVLQDYSQEQVTVPEANFGDTAMNYILDTANENVAQQAAVAEANTQAMEKTFKPTRTAALSMSTPQSQKIADNHGSAPDSVREAAKSIMQDPDKLEAKLDQIDAMKAEGKELGMVDGFLDALSFFIPQALGTLVGTALGGVEAGAHAGNVAGDLQSKYLGFKAKQEELNIEQRKLQQQSMPTYKRAAGMINAKTGAGVSFNEKTNTYYEIGTGNIVPIEDVFDVNRAREDEKMNILIKGENRRNAIYALSLKQVAEVDPGFSKDIGNYTSVKGLLNDIDDMVSSDSSLITKDGFYTNRVQEFLNSQGIGSDGKFSTISAALKQVASAYQQAVSGLTVSEGEVNRLAAQLPNYVEKPAVFRAKLKQLKALVDSKVRSAIEIKKRGEPLKIESLNNIENFYNSKLSYLDRAKAALEAKKGK